MDFIGEFDSIQELLGTEIKVEKELVFVDTASNSLLASNSHIPINTVHMGSNPMLVGGNQLGGISTYSGLFNDDDDDNANQTGAIEDTLLNAVLKFESPDSFEENDDDFEDDFDIQFDNNEVKIEEPFDCDTLDRDSMLENHMNAIEEFNENSKNRNKRKNCDSSGPESRRLKEQRYQCDQCDAKYTKRRNLTIHVESKHLKLSHTCTICGSKTTNKDRFRQHMNKHTDKSIVQCSYCFVKFKDTNELNEHEQTHSKSHQGIEPDDESHPEFDEPSEQSTIDTEYNEQDNITFKEDSHSEIKFEEDGDGSGVDEMIMEQFDEIMKQKGSDYAPDDDDFVLEEDEIEYKDEVEPPNVPNSINQQFTLNDSLPNDEKRYQCDQCDASYTKRNNLNIHIQSKHLMLVFKCTICKHQTSNKDRFRRHMAKHTEMGLLKCRYCNIKFKNETDLIPHEESHADPTIIQPGSTRVKYLFRPNGNSFECSGCKKAFSTMDAIKDHVKHCHKQIQSQQRTDPVLEVSSKRSKSKSVTNIVNPKTFKCPKCPRVFGRSGDVKRHFKVHEV